MDSQAVSTGTVAAVVAIVLAVFVPFILWCIYAFRMRQTNMRLILGMTAAEVAALVSIAILAHF